MTQTVGRKRRRRGPSADRVLWQLREAYGPVERRQARSPMDQLVSTVISQHTSDSNTARAFASLKKRFPEWESVLNADEQDVADAIRSGGLANVKAQRIREMLTAIRDRKGELSIDFLADLPLSEAKAWLRELPGVGPKTAAVVLVFALGMPALPVDTHVYRVSTRLGLIPPKTSFDRAHDILERQVEPEDVFEFHMQLIRHGRQTGKARRPRCKECPLQEECPAAPGFMRAEERRHRTPARSDRRSKQ
jgi:endonuclease-3